MNTLEYSVGVNVFHMLVVAPLLVFLSRNCSKSTKTQKLVVNLLMPTALGIFLYHLYRAMSKLGWINF